MAKALRAFLLQFQQLDELVLIESDHRLTVDQSHRRALKPGVEQFFERGLIRADIFFNENNALLR